MSHYRITPVVIIVDALVTILILVLAAAHGTIGTGLTIPIGFHS